MNHPLTSFLLSGLFLAILATPLRAGDPDAAVMRMRETLRNTMLQLRTAQTDLAAAQAVQAEGDLKNKTLTAQLSDLAIKTASDRDASRKEIADLDAKLEDHE